MSDVIWPTLSSYLAQSPIFLVWIVGIVLALARWQRHRQVSFVALVAIALFFVEALIGTYTNIQLPMLMVQNGWSASQIGVFLTVKGFIQALVAAVGWGLLLMAIFGWRNPNTQQDEIPFLSKMRQPTHQPPD